ncbi:MAG TPA: hypothetical protein VK826_16955 [Bacteroidia bacterium]|nr:hypothetical protein [Bacteroidia bacterium]
MNSYSTPGSNPNDSPDSKTQKVNTIWRSVMALYILGVIGLIFYWEMNDEGLPIMICELQACDGFGFVLHRAQLSPVAAGFSPPDFSREIYRAENYRGED